MTQSFSVEATRVAGQLGDARWFGATPVHGTAARGLISCSSHHDKDRGSGHQGLTAWRHSEAFEHQLKLGMNGKADRAKAIRLKAAIIAEILRSAQTYVWHVTFTGG